jgi:hypothetical protein
MMLVFAKSNVLLFNSFIDEQIDVPWLFYSHVDLPIIFYMY